MPIGPSSGETVSGLRTRYVPRSRLGQGLMNMAPWLDLVLLILFFLMIRGNLVVQPGVVVDLPTLPLKGGAPMDISAVVLSLQTGPRGARDEIVVFQDQSYRMDTEVQVAKLGLALGVEVKQRRASSLLLAADAHVQHGTLVKLYGMARDAGLLEVNLAASPAQSDAGAGAK